MSSAACTEIYTPQSNTAVCQRLSRKNYSKQVRYLAKTSNHSGIFRSTQVHEINKSNALLSSKTVRKQSVDITQIVSKIINRPRSKCSLLTSANKYRVNRCVYARTSNIQSSDTRSVKLRQTQRKSAYQTAATAYN